ncbi:hypothetical protein HPB52_004980 [Rhipicephalus sanguineus]|uniref:Uncharacterized protein n=1 Tax=Rhipicephalus sanguineus TaxID=34632 RepID=A0A9D4SXR6_RHISA|nr:hypothetical protein HPB52_004980 [Rhipicephalus sanguineus]
MEDRIYKRGEPIECYYFDKLAKARRCNLSDEACIEYLITGLNNQDIIRAISTHAYDSPEELLCCLKRLKERVRAVGSRDIKHSKVSEFQNPAGHGNKEYRAAETALNENRIGIKYSLIGKPLTIGGYGSGRVTPYGETNVNLTVDQATADVPVLIVPNESQAIPVIVGHPFTEQPHVMIVR